MSRSSDTGVFADERKRWLEHNLQTAGIARFLTTRLTPKIDPGKALLAGLVHDLGAFFVLDRVARNEELVERPASPRFVVAQWHESVGAILLDALNLPEEIIEAVAEIDYPRPTIKQRSCHNRRGQTGEWPLECHVTPKILEPSAAGNSATLSFPVSKPTSCATAGWGGDARGSRTLARWRS